MGPIHCSPLQEDAFPNSQASSHARAHTHTHKHRGHPGFEKKASEQGGLLRTQFGGSEGKGVITVQDMKAELSGSLPGSHGLGPQILLGSLFTAPKKVPVRNLEPHSFGSQTAQGAQQVNGRSGTRTQFLSPVHSCRHTVLPLQAWAG